MKYEELGKAIQQASKQVVTRKFKKLRKKIFGYNQNIKLEIQERRKRCSLWKKEKDEEKQKELEEEYKEQKRKVNDIMDRTEAEEISKIIEKNGNESIDYWKMMRRIKKKVQTTRKIRKANGEMTEDCEEILEAKKEYYQKLYSKPIQSIEEKEEEERIKIGLENERKIGNDLDINKKVSIKEIEDSIMRSKNNKAPGPDHITNEMVKKGKI